MPNVQAAPSIAPDAIYHDGDVRLMLGLTSSTMARARREGRLRFSRQGHSILYRGQWLVDWLERDAAPIGETAQMQGANSEQPKHGAVPC